MLDITTAKTINSYAKMLVSEGDFTEAALLLARLSNNAAAIAYAEGAHLIYQKTGEYGQPVAYLLAQSIRVTKDTMTASMGQDIANLICDLGNPIYDQSPPPQQGGNKIGYIPKTREEYELMLKLTPAELARLGVMVGRCGEYKLPDEWRNYVPTCDAVVPYEGGYYLNKQKAN